ncbi:alpha/beta fold hydrolase [Elioraea rosea]|uniref:alpha/beta fold hydrolase n=1 Tax=Elioraea rosea TaxID=2492390 RepID=UPI001185C531|nr:alpha/beta hydrolase [Elioraea rosea]
MIPETHQGPNGPIAFEAVPGRGPAVVFLGGLRSDMTGTKAAFLRAWCCARGRGFLRFDYTGHGASSGRFEDGTIGAWTEDALSLIAAVTRGPLVLVGSSMGGWVMLEVALAIADRVAALVGIAAAPDFTEDLIWNVLDERQRERLAREGVVTMPNPYDPEGYPIGRALIEEGRTRLRLRGPIPIAVPVRLLHGQDDAEVPWETSIRLAAYLESLDVRVTLVKDGDHRLSREADLALLGATLSSLPGENGL